MKSITQWLWASASILGMFVLVWSAGNAWRMMSCRQWPVTEGMIVASELKQGLMREGALRYRADIVYGYTVDGKKYQGKRISFAGQTKASSDKLSLVKAYPKGFPVQVHYAPSHPAVATLETRASWQVLKPLIGGLLLAAFGIVGFWRRWPMQTDFFFKQRDPDAPVAKWDIVAGGIGLTACLGIVWLWWELIKMYAGR